MESLGERERKDFLKKPAVKLRFFGAGTRFFEEHVFFHLKMSLKFDRNERRGFNLPDKKLRNHLKNRITDFPEALPLINGLLNTK